MVIWPSLSPSTVHIVYGWPLRGPLKAFQLLTKNHSGFIQIVKVLTNNWTMNFFSKVHFLYVWLCNFPIFKDKVASKFLVMKKYWQKLDSEFENPINLLSFLPKMVWYLVVSNMKKNILPFFKRILGPMLPQHWGVQTRSIFY